jgi:hypothetical protein
MNAVSSLAHFQLKYCERCGGLWLRPDSAATPYCPACDQFMSALPVRQPRNQHQRKPARRATVTAGAAVLTSALQVTVVAVSEVSA